THTTGCYTLSLHDALPISVELVKGEVTSLVYPARAEIVAEGTIPPDSQKLEGPFGEFTGYYGRPEDLAFLVHVKAVHYRDNPIRSEEHTSELQSLAYLVCR